MKTIVLCLLLATALAQVSNTTEPESTAVSNTTAAPASTKWIFGGVLTSNQVVPSDTNSSASGILLAFYDGELTLKYYIMHNVEDAMEVRFFSGADMNSTGTALYKTSTSSRTMLTGEWKLSPGQIGDLYSKRQYVDVTSKNFPAGEIRIVLDLAPYVYGVQYISMLDFSQTTKEGLTASVGTGLMVLGGGFNYRKEFMVASIIHNLNDTTSAAIYGPADYCKTASSALEFPSSAITKSGFMQYQFSTMKAQDWSFMDKSQYYVQLASKSYQDGEIRGQIQPPIYYTSSTMSGFEKKVCVEGVTETPSPTRIVDNAGPMMGISAALSALVLAFTL